MAGNFKPRVRGGKTELLPMGLHQQGGAKEGLNQLHRTSGEYSTNNFSQCIDIVLYCSHKNAIQRLPIFFLTKLKEMYRVHFDSEYEFAHHLQFAGKLDCFLICQLCVVDY